MSWKAVKHFLNRYLYGLYALVFPRECMFCHRHLLQSETWVCRLCIDELPATMYEYERGNEVEQRMAGRVNLKSGFSCYFFRKGENLREIIHGFKYNNHVKLAQIMGIEMGRHAWHSGFIKDYDYIIPVPLHPKKLKARGYNQSLILAEGISKVTGVPVITDALLRTVYAGSQTFLKADERYHNVKSDFALGPGADKLKGKSVLLVDDVFTTGATTEACILPLQEIEGVQVGIATLAYAGE